METNQEEAAPPPIDWINKEIKTAMERMPPAASSGDYTKTYSKYQEWRTTNSLQGPTDGKELSAFLHHKLESGKWVSPGKLWCKFSILRTTIISQDGIDIKGANMNATIQTWPKWVGNEHRTKQVRIFTKADVHRFFIDAPKTMVGYKLTLPVGVYMGLQCEMLALLEWRHVKITEGKV
jgi:hypothetical protein